jgi:Asp-tRNA(Asn)/Glu-tRNA(Gln) amidotransferase B subunit
MSMTSHCRPTTPHVLTAEVETARWFEALLLRDGPAQGKQPAEVAKQAANWLISEFFGALNKAGHELADSPVSHAQAAELLALIGKGTISGSIAKQVLETMLETGDGAAAIVEREGSDAAVATAARSRPRSTRSSPTTPTRSRSTRPARRRCSGSSSARR